MIITTTGSLAILGIAADFIGNYDENIQDLESVIFGVDKANNVNFPAFPFLINHLRRQGLSSPAVKWFLARQSNKLNKLNKSNITIQSVAESSNLVYLTPTELVEELLDHAAKLGNSELVDDRQLGKDLRTFVVANVQSSLRSRL